MNLETHIHMKNQEKKVHPKADTPGYPGMESSGVPSSSQSLGNSPTPHNLSAITGDLHSAGNEASHIMALLHWVRIRNNPGYPRSQTASVCPGSHNHIKSKHPSADLWNIPAVDPRIYKSNRNLIHMKVA
jgi:hypothetical protein